MKKYRVTAAAAAALLMTASLAGCGDQGIKKYDKLLDKDSPVVITIWHYYNGVQQTQFDEMVNEFNSTVGIDDGIIVEAFSKNSVNELSDAVLASADNDPGSEELPNIFGTYAETAYVMDNMGLLADMSKYFTEEELSEYVDEYIAEGRMGSADQLKIFPVAKSTEVMMINATDWDKFAAAENITYDNMKTWEGLADTAEKYYNYTDALTPDVENDGKALFGRDSLANYLIVGAKQLGGEFAAADENGNITVSADKEAVRKLWDNFYVPFVKGYFAAESRYRSDDMKTGSIIAMVCSNSASTYCPTEVTVSDDESYPIDISVLPVPNFEGCDPYVVQQGAGLSVIKSDEKTEYACAKFMKWFTEEDRNIDFAVSSGYLPVKKSSNDITKISTHEEGMKDYMKQTFETAIGEINGSTLYTSPPYEKSADMRSYIQDAMSEKAVAAHEEAYGRIEAGEDRNTVLEEYTNDAAFEDWYNGFKSGFDQIIGNG